MKAPMTAAATLDTGAVRGLASARRVVEEALALALAARRRLHPVPVEPIPAFMRAGAAARTPSEAAHASADDDGPQVAPTTATAPARPLATPAVTGASQRRGAPPRSMKSGPPKAPRRRALVAVGPGLAPTPSAGAIADAIVGVGAPTRDAPPEAIAIPVFSDADEAIAIPIALPAPACPPADSAASFSHKPQVIALVQSPAVERVRSTRAQQVGDDGERLAALRLEALGWRILARNLRVNRAEVDILAIDPAEPPSLVLVEVRRRNRRDFGLVEETVDYRKRNCLRRAAGELAARPVLGDGRRLPHLPVRVDLIAIDRGPDGRPSLRHHRGIEV